MKKQLILFMLIFYSLFSYAQTSGNKWNYGIYFGAFKPILNSPIDLPEKARIENGYGFSTGILIEYNFFKNISILPKAGISFGESKVKFYEDNIEDYFLMQFTFDLLLDFKIQLYSSKSSPYCLLGAKYNYPPQNKNLRNIELEAKSNYSLELGFGFEKTILNKIMIAPELRYSNGITNLNLSPKLSKLKYNSLSLIINFKGLK